MLRSIRSRVIKKQGIMTDHQSSNSSSSSPTKPPQSFFGSPRFKAFTAKNHGEGSNETSPCSTLDTRPFSPFKNPFWYEVNQPKSPKVEEKHRLDVKGIGLALLDKPVEENTSSCYNPSPKVLFGAKLSIQIPPLLPPSISPSGSPGSQSGSPAINYGIQTKDSDGVLKSFLSVSEMELSEDYTRVISHGPNPKTTHIFGNFILESNYSITMPNSANNKDFLSFCYTCKANLDQKRDIFIYRGEQAFCSKECRSQAMLLDEEEN